MLIRRSQLLVPCEEDAVMCDVKQGNRGDRYRYLSGSGCVAWTATSRNDSFEMTGNRACMSYIESGSHETIATYLCSITQLMLLGIFGEGGRDSEWTLRVSSSGVTGSSRGRSWSLIADRLRWRGKMMF